MFALRSKSLSECGDSLRGEDARVEVALPNEEVTVPLGALSVLGVRRARRDDFVCLDGLVDATELL